MAAPASVLLVALALVLLLLLSWMLAEVAVVLAVGLGRPLLEFRNCW